MKPGDRPKRLWFSRFATSKRLSNTQLREAREAGMVNAKQTNVFGLWRVRAFATLWQVSAFVAGEASREQGK